MPSPAPGVQLSQYRLERLLGEGGMGAVYLAHDTVLDRPVAIKFIAAARAGDEASRRRLIGEARAAAALDHPNICAVHEIIIDPDNTCIVMQYVEGETLAARLRGGPLDARLALSVAADIAAALAEAHKRGVVHRDLKPQNVMLTPASRAKLLDFGIARLAMPGGSDEATATALTQPGGFAGTVPYVSPEQARQESFDGRSDLFSLGAVLYECLTGRKAFPGPSDAETLHQVLYEEPPPPSSLRQELTQQHDELCARLLAKHPDDRFQSAEELLGALRVSSTRSTSTTPTAVRAQLTRRRWPATARRTLAAALLVAAGIAIVYLTQTLWQRPPPPQGRTIVGVLPFRNESGDPAHDALAAGLSDALAKRLASVGALRVLPLDETREAARGEADGATVARSLGAALLIEGAVVRGGSGPQVRAGLVGLDGRKYPPDSHPVAGSLLDVNRQVADGVLIALSRLGVIAAEAAPEVMPTSDADAFSDYSQGRVFLERPDVPGNLDHAARLFQSAIRRDPRFALAHAALAETYLAQYRETNDPSWMERATSANLEALRIDPTQPEVRQSLAVMYQVRGQHDQAMEELRQVIEHPPQNDNAYRLLATLHSDRANWAAAIEAARQAVSIRPTYWRNYSQLGLVYYRAGKFPEAVAAYERLVELQPDSARGYQALGTALQAGGRIDEALDKYEKALSIEPSGATYSNVGTVHFWRGDYQKAADAYERAVALRPNRDDLHANLGDSYAKLGRRAEAVQAYRRAVDLVQKALSVSENDAPAVASLALYQAKLGLHDRAARSIARAIALRPLDASVLYAAALVHALGGRTEPACAALADAIANGASIEEIRHASELTGLKGCQAYDLAIHRKE
jgi:serine/threonine-protein kinase